MLEQVVMTMQNTQIVYSSSTFTYIFFPLSYSTMFFVVSALINTILDNIISDMKELYMQ